MTVATLTSKGQVTLPKDIRDHFQLASGDKVDFFLDGQGEVRIKPMNKSLLSLKGLLQRPGKKPVSLKQMEKSIQHFDGFDKLTAGKLSASQARRRA